MDTNIYLDYFRAQATPDRLEPLKRLLELVKDGKITLLVPEQIINEYQRDRRKVAEETRDLMLKESQYSPSVHFVMGKTKKVVKSVAKAVESVRRSYKNLVEKYDKHIDEESTEADKIIKELFDKGKKLADSESLIKKAEIRYLKGNPPKKNNFSYGDAIVWETILETATKDPIVIISHDSDYTERYRGKRDLNAFLKSEWKLRSRKKISFYESLGEFINSFDNKETIKKEVVEKEKETSFISSVAVSKAPFMASVMGADSTMTASVNPFWNSEPLQAVTLSDYALQNMSGYSLANNVVYGQKNNPVFCPYCGTKDPLDRNDDQYIVGIVYRSSVRNCKKCGKIINLL